MFSALRHLTTVLVLLLEALLLDRWPSTRALLCVFASEPARPTVLTTLCVAVQRD